MLIIEKIKDNEELFKKDICTIYIKNIDVAYRRYRDSIHITDIHAAMKRGCQCRTVIIMGIIEVSERPDIEEILINPNLFETEYEKIYRNFDSKYVFNPFITPKKVNIEKTKFTLNDLKKMLLNGQIEKAVIKRQTTDDYFDDEECGYNKGVILNKKELCRDLVQEPAGWRICSSDKGKLNFHNLTISCDEDNKYYVEIACHYFKYIKLYLSL
ncbi:MAG: hypothetical protein JXB50_08080 [Spirochaetes bacterium]|nr:hypothetical protein [Spirochaetota bacterium]